MASSVVNKVDEPKPIPSIPMRSLQLFEHANAHWRVVLPDGVAPEMLEDPTLWAVVSLKLHPFDRIEVLGAGALWWAELLVITAEKGFAPVLKVLRIVEFPALPPNHRTNLPNGYRIDYDPTSALPYRAIRDRDGLLMAGPHKTYEDCRTALVSHACFRT